MANAANFAPTTKVSFAALTKQICIDLGHLPGGEEMRVKAATASSSCASGP